MRHKLVTLLLIAAALFLTASNGYSQSSTDSIPTSSDRERLITKTELAVQEVILARSYIRELEINLKATELQAAELEKAGSLDKALIKSLQDESNELRAAIDALKTANAERVKEIGKMQKKINDLQNKVSFWRKFALTSTGILAAGAAAVVLLN